MRMASCALAAAILAGACAHAHDPAAFQAALREAAAAADRQQAIAILERTRRAYPEHRDATDVAIARLYARMDQPERSLEVLEQAHRAGVFFGLVPQMDWIQPLRYLRGFQAVLDRDNALRAEADRAASMRYRVVRPEGYSPGRSYPLFIVLHAGGDDMENARRYWHSPGLDRILTVYVQSARHLTSSSFTWLGRDAETRAGLRRIYDEVTARYRVDPRHVLVGGMSAGGMMSLDVVFHDVIPVTGFIVNCPTIPVDFDASMAGDVARRGIRGVLLTGAGDFSLDRQKEVVAAFARAGVAHRFTVIPGLGHAMPPDFATRLDDALAELGAVAEGQPLAPGADAR